MSATTPQPQALTAAPASARLTGFLAARPVWQVGVPATLAGAAVTEAFALVSRGAGVSMPASSPGEAEAAEIPVGGFAGGVLFWSVVGVVLAVALARWAGRPRRTFVVATVALTALSLAGPAVAPHTALSTQVVLAVSHLVAAAVIIPVLARRLPVRRG
jgi:hypothetical protein